MVNSFPASPLPIDGNADGFTDTIFAVDILGHVWRVDLSRKPTSASDFMAGAGMIANLEKSTTVGDITYHHRYYNAPDVAFFNTSKEGAYLTIAVGSGYRASPLLKDMKDSFYLFKDYNVFDIPDDYKYYRELDENFAIVEGSKRVLEATDLGDVDDENAVFTFGWQKSFETAGEKVLASSVTFDGNVLFTTFAPTPEGVVDCSGDLGISTAYYVTTKKGSTIYKKDLNVSGIPPEPAIIFVPKEPPPDLTDEELETYSQSDPVACIGLDCSITTDLEPVTKAFWRVNNDK
jgi:type IV pilus assembly protein PilY1